MAESPWLACVRGLELRCNGIDAEALEHLTNSRYLCQLQALDLSYNPIGWRGVERLTAAHCTDDLGELHLTRWPIGREATHPPATQTGPAVASARPL